MAKTNRGKRELPRLFAEFVNRFNCKPKQQAAHMLRKNHHRRSADSLEEREPTVGRHSFCQEGGARPIEWHHPCSFSGPVRAEGVKRRKTTPPLRRGDRRAFGNGDREQQTSSVLGLQRWRDTGAQRTDADPEAHSEQSGELCQFWLSVEVVTAFSSKLLRNYRQKITEEWVS